MRVAVAPADNLLAAIASTGCLRVAAQPFGSLRIVTEKGHYLRLRVGAN